MAAPEDLGQLNTVNWRRLQELADTYHDLRRHGRAVDFEPYLPPPESPLRRLVLHELIVVDLEVRWREHQGVRLEHYLERFPELGSAPQLPAKLIYEEFRVRSHHGDRPLLESYRNRFPAQYDELRRLADAGSGRPTPSSASRPTVLAPPDKGAEPVQGVLAGYRWVERIGSGSFGEVWRAEAPGGFPAAIKMIFGPIDQEEGQRERAALDMVRGLRHPYLLQTHFYESSQDRLYIVMELADGSLRDRLEACRRAGQAGIPQAELLRYFREAAEGLDYLHAKHVHHRDVKPENVLLIEGHAKLADFGLARIQEGSRRLASATGVGTPLYMAPEVFKGKVSRHSDQYSLALAYAELRLGRRPLAGTNLMDIMFEHLEKTPDLNPLPAAEQAALRRALSKEPEDRYPSCGEFVQALEEARTAPARPAPPPPPPPPEPPVLAHDPPAPPTQARPGVKPTGRRTDPNLVRVTGRVSVGRLTGRADQLPSWRESRPKQSSAAAWVLVVVLALLLVLLAIYLVQTQRPRPPSDAGPLQLDPPQPVQVVAGKAAPLTLHVRRGGYGGPITLKFSGLPPKVTIADTTLEPDAGGAQLTVTADPAARPATTQVLIAADGGDQHREASVELTVLRLPADCRPLDNGRLARDEALRLHYAQIARQLDDGTGTEVPFVLIPWGREGDRSTFYMMVDKVSVGLFRKYLQAKGAQAPRAWNGADAETENDRPAMQVGVGDAFRFAEWLGGKLPTVEQWDKAAGRFDQGGREGPYQGKWNDAAPLQIAVRRRDKAPLPVGAAKDDVSVFGCRDMAGNGLEWTSTIGPIPGRLAEKHLDSSRPEVFRPSVQLRGRGFTEAEPLRFRDLDALDGTTKQMGLRVGETLPEVGFRVVLELN
jgi:serine/threonine protein kinase